MAGRLEGKVALVTGASSGIGKATAILFGQEGAKVIVAARRIREGEETVEMIRKAGSEAIFVSTDVSKATEVEALINKTVETYGRLDCALNNAGNFGNQNLTAECDEENFDRVINVHLKGMWLCMKYEILQMLKQGSGAIVNMSSILGLTGGGDAAYVASKHGIIGLTKVAALEYAKSGLRVNAVCPGYIYTRMIELMADISDDPDFEAGLIKQEPVGRMGTPEEVAEAVVWLCSDAASFVTGHAMLVDGGYVAQ